MNSSKKRKADNSNDDREQKRVKSGRNKLVKVTLKPGPAAPEKQPEPPQVEKTVPEPAAATQGPRRKKLAPQRPFPTVPASVSATGPPSAHKEGKNLICLTRKTTLGAYLRRCKNLILKDGYQTLHLSAMGAAIPLLLSLSAALPPILPFAEDEISLNITTGTVTVTDEITPADEDEEITYEQRGKSTLLIVLKIGDGEFVGDMTPAVNRRVGKLGRAGRGGKGKPRGEAAKQSITFQEPEQPDPSMDMAY